MLVIGGFSLLFAWLFARPFLEQAYLAESDLYKKLPAALLFHVLGYLLSAFVVGAAGIYAYVYSLTRSPLASTVAGLAYALSEAMMERIAHLNILHVIALTPIVLLSIDGVRGSRPERWIVIGALSAGSAFVIGQPQPALYAWLTAALYALAGGWAASRAGGQAPWGYWARVALMFVLAAALSAVKLMPQLEVMTEISRQTQSFERFVDPRQHSHADAVRALPLRRPRRTRDADLCGDRHSHHGRAGREPDPPRVADWDSGS